MGEEKTPGLPEGLSPEQWRRAELERKFDVLNFFKYSHLPPVLQAFSKPFADTAYAMADQLFGSAHPGEVAVGLRKILEAKDCFVRARLPKDGLPIKG